MDGKKDSPENQFYTALLELTENAVKDELSLEGILEILTLHGLNTYLRDPNNSFCCASDLMLRIFSRWYNLNHEKAMTYEDDAPSEYDMTNESEATSVH